jgi:CRP/FNR family cyclic AMP-dependent transcriptional regulator
MNTPLVSQTFDAGAFFSAVASDRRVTQYRKKHVIFSQGDKSDSLFYIESGSVKLTIVSREGNEAIISVAEAGSFIGEGCISSEHAVRLHSAVALTNVQLVTIESLVVKRLLVGGGNAALNLVALLLRQNARIQEDLAKRLVDSSEESLTRVVSSFMQYKDKQSHTGLPRISQQSLAEMIGVSRQHVNALMKRIRKYGPPQG